MTSNDLNLCQLIAKVQSFHILSFEVLSRGLGKSLYAPIFLIFFHLKHSKTHIQSLFLLKTVDIDLIKTQVFYLSNLSTFSLPGQFQVSPFENCTNKILI